MSNNKIQFGGDIAKCRANIRYEETNYNNLKYRYEQSVKKLFDIGYNCAIENDKNDKKALDKEYRKQYKVASDLFLEWGACYTRLHCNIDLLNDLLKMGKDSF